MVQGSVGKTTPFAAPGMSVVKGVLSRAEHPAALAEYLAGEFLSLSGASLVAVVRCTSGAGCVLGVARRGGEELLPSSPMLGLVHQACALTEPAFLGEEAAAPVPGNSLLWPLRLADRTVGSLVLLGLPRDRRPSLEEPLQTVAEVAALALGYGALCEEGADHDEGRDLLGQSLAELQHSNHELQRELVHVRPVEHAVAQDVLSGSQVLDAEGRFLEVNDTALRWLGYRREDLVGVKKFADILTPEGVRVLRRQLPGLKGGGAQWGGEFELVRKDGTTFPVLLNAVAERDQAGELLRIRATLFHTGALKSAQQELQTKNEELKMSRLALLNLVDDLNRKSSEIVQANVRLKDVDQLKSMFIASMSHELRTPLNSVIGFSSILLNEWVGPLNVEQRENLETVLRSGKHLLALVNDVIDVSKVEAGQVERNLDRFDLYDVIEEVAALLEQEIRHRGLELIVENLHQRMVTDRRRLLQCLINVLGNSAKYTEQGRIEVTVRLVPGSGATPDAVEIAVRDTGVGIKEEEMGRLFNPFARMESHLRSSVLGTGLGLYLTKKLMEEVLEGTITAQSVYGEGSRFFLTLPTVPTAAAADE